MPESEDKDWSPESELDPAKLQAEGIKQLRRVADLGEADERRRIEADKKFTEDRDVVPQSVGMVPAFVRPSFSEISDRLKRAWEETHRIAPEAPAHVQMFVIQTLYHTLPEDTGSEGVGGVVA